MMRGAGGRDTSFEGNPQLLRGLSDEPREDGREERPEKEVFDQDPHRCIASIVSSGILNHSECIL